jgi:colanic acid/amylovoran biosynthesis glycosyltransferase
MGRVGHVVAAYLAQTETFIYNQLVGLQPSSAVVFALRFENLDQFPLDIPVFPCAPNSPAPQIVRLARRAAREAGLYRWLVRAPEGSLISVLRREHVRIIHAHFGPIGSFALPAARALRLPLVTSFYGVDASLLPRDPTWRRAYALLFRNGAKFVVEGPAMEARLIRLGCAREKIAIVPIAIDISRYRFQRRPRAPTAGPVRLLFVGRLVEKKGAEFAIIALQEVVASGIEASLDIIGAGPLRERLENEVGARGLGPRVRFHGMCRHSEVIGFLDTSDVFLAPSVTAADGDSEGGAPTILLEAQASGLPIVSTTHADIPAVTLPGRSALLSEEGDGREFARLTVQLCSRPETWGQMGEAGAAFVRAKHGREVVQERLRDVYGVAGGWEGAVV